MILHHETVSDRRASNRRVCTVLGTGACALVALAFGWRMASQPQPAEPPLATAAIAPSPAASHSGASDAVERLAAATMGRGVYRAPVGSLFHYRIEMSQRMVVRQEKPGASEPAMDYRLRGSASLVVRARPEAEIVVGFRIEAAELSGVDGGAAAVARLGQETLARLGEDGSVRGYRFSASLGASERNLVRTAFAQLGFTVPCEVVEPSGPATWSTLERDASGVAACDYRWVRREASGTGGELERRRQRYTALAHDAGGQRGHELRGVATARFAPAIGWLESARAEERFRFQVVEMSMEVESSFAGRLELTEASRLAGPLPAVEAGEWQPAGGHEEDLEAQRDASMAQHWAQRLGGVTLRDLIDALAKLLAEGRADSPELYAAWERLAWLLKLRDAAVVELGDLLRSQQASGELAALLLTAAGKAATPAAQRLLTATYADSALPVALRQAAVDSMFQLGRPTAETMASLVGSLERTAPANELGVTGLLLLGTLSSRSSDRLPDGRTAFETLVAMQGRTTQQGTTEAWLSALGNSGRPEVLALAAPHLNASDAWRRAAAIDALRKVEAGAATAALAERAQRDPHPGVRTSATEALAARSEARDCLIDILGRDPSPDVRRAAMHGLGARKGDAVARRALEAAAANDASTGLRKLAADLLARS